MQDNKSISSILFGLYSFQNVKEDLKKIVLMGISLKNHDHVYSMHSNMSTNLVGMLTHPLKYL